jgi:hypothetical protein
VNGIAAGGRGRVPSPVPPVPPAVPPVVVSAAVTAGVSWAITFSVPVVGVNDGGLLIRADGDPRPGIPNTPPGGVSATWTGGFFDPIFPGETLTLDYTPGTVRDEQDVPLAAFAGFPVANNP